MGLRVQTQVSGNAFVLHCEGRIVFGDEGAALRERVGSLLSGTPKIVVNLGAVEHIDSGGIGILVGLFVGKKPRWRPQAGLSEPACHRRAPTYKPTHDIHAVRKRS